MTKRILYLLGTIFLICLTTLILIAYGRGYRFNFGRIYDPKEKNILTATGILSATSQPDGASIWIDGKLTSATNTSISLPPGWYQLKIGKEGYQSWEKRIRLQGEVVTRADALLIPANPSLRAITVSGILAPSLSPTSTKVAYIIANDQATPSSTLKSKIGVWVMDLKNGPLGGKSEPKLLFQPFSKMDWLHASLVWSPDEKQLILKFSKKTGNKETVLSAYQINTDNGNILPAEISNSLKDITEVWKQLQVNKDDEMLDTMPQQLAILFKSSTGDIRFSPDETKILYLATQSATLTTIINPPLIGTNTTTEVRRIETGKYYIYDTKEDKNFYISDKKTFPNPKNLIWYTDSKHIIIIEKDTIYIMDYDGTNKRIVYAGPFEENVVFPWASGGKLVILTNFNKPKSTPNLYEIDLR